MNKTLISSTAFAVFTAIALPTLAAEDLKCGCYAPVEDKIAAANPVNGYNLNCESNDRFTETGTAVSVQKSDLKVYVGANGAIQGDNDMNITFRSRNKEYLVAAYDGSDKHLLWGGMKNDNNDQQVDGFRIKNVSEGTWTASFQADTTGKNYKGVVLFNDLGNGKKTMTALCLRDH
ncbi:hypothetical protein GPUN_1578 [Glaciecola punicea ACAM 611]|jgi:hypothetical protein|uniref:Secreted protein n=1 Tax=Glaciecola punicea ACAM 611 TaxID=1121923 RepID=H5TBL8_9ALTE|nr:hypothetical protein [Glaciecola punicea]GAB55695.1 hypothetical protein GPUN_1578 [Glaciecola punicea ACAM 611]